MSRHYTTKEIRDFIKCPQFGDSKYGRWGALKIEIRETLLNLINLVESMDAVIQQKDNIIKEVRERLLNEYSPTMLEKYGTRLKNNVLEILDKEK